MPRPVHPLAWWGWAIGVAVAASTTTNPLLLVGLVVVQAVVVTARRGDSPWARSFRLYLALGGFVVGWRVLLNVLVGLKFGTIELVSLPRIALPGWAAGIDLLGPVYLEGLLAAVLTGLRLAVLITSVGAANALANPKRVLRALPAALHEIGTALVVAVAVAPQLADSVQRVRRARLLRGESSRGPRALGRVCLPVLQDTLDRSLMLASAMESRGYGRRSAGDRGLLPGTAGLAGLLLVALGTFGVLDTGDAPAWLGVPTLLAGVVLLAAGLWAAGRAVQVTSYRPDRWGWPELVTLGCGVGVAVAFLVSLHTDAAAMAMPLSPLGAPRVDPIALAGVLIAVLPGFLTPAPGGRS